MTSVGAKRTVESGKEAQDKDTKAAENGGMAIWSAISTFAERGGVAHHGASHTGNNSMLAEHSQ